MAKLFFKLNGVPDDEANEVRQLLEDADIHFYETSAGNWGVSLPAIWLSDESQLDRAQVLLDEYQHARQFRVREEAQQQPPETFLQRLLNAPLQVLAYGLLILAILYISIAPFLDAWSPKP